MYRRVPIGEVQTTAEVRGKEVKRREYSKKQPRTRRTENSNGKCTYLRQGKNTNPQTTLHPKVERIRNKYIILCNLLVNIKLLATSMIKKHLEVK